MGIISEDDDVLDEVEGVVGTGIEAGAPRDIQAHTGAPRQRQTETQTETEAPRSTQKHPEAPRSTQKHRYRQE